MRKSVATLVGAAATVAMISGAGLASASPRPAAARTEHFQVMSTSFTASRSSLVAYGGFTAGGIDVQHRSGTDTFTFAAGSFRVTHKITGGHQHFSLANCLLAVSQHGTYKLSTGTGRYAGIRGSGRVTISLIAVGRRNSHGTCETSPFKPITSQTILTGQGPVTLP